MADSRQRLKPWLVAQINGGQIPGLFWLNDEHTKFQMPWAHKGRHDWAPESCLLFKEWEKNNGRFQEGIHEPNYPEWKTRMRCALHKSSDFELIKEESVTESFRIYQLKDKDNRQVLAGRNLNQNPASPYNRDTLPAAPLLALPACVEDACVSGDGSLPSDIKDVSTSDMRLLDPQETSMIISFDPNIDIDMLSNNMSSLGLGRGPTAPPAVPTDVKPTLRQAVGPPPADSLGPSESQLAPQMRSLAPPPSTLPQYDSDLDVLDAILGAYPPAHPPQLAEGQLKSSTAQVGGLYTNSAGQSTVIDRNQAEQNGGICPNADDQRDKMFLNPAGEVNVTYENPADQGQGIYQNQPGQEQGMYPTHPPQQVPDSSPVAQQRIAYERIAHSEIPEQAYTHGVYVPPTEPTVSEFFGAVNEDDPDVIQFLDDLLNGADVSTLVQQWGENDGGGAEFDNYSLY